MGRLPSTLAIGLVLTLAATACGTRDEPTAPAEPEAEQPAEGEEGELRELGRAWQQAEATVTYEQTTVDAAGSESVGTLTLTWRPPSSWRTDLTAEGMASTTIVTADRTVVCTGETCLALPSADDPDAAGIVGPGFFDPTAIAEGLPEEAPGVERSADSIAGEEASCFAVAAGTDGAADAEWCFSGDGILLRYAATGAGPEGAGSFLLEASNVEREVPDDAFDPPFPVMDVPTEDEHEPPPYG